MVRIVSEEPEDRMSSKKAQDLLFHIKRKSSTVKGKGWKPEKTLPGNDLLGADNTQKLLYIFAVVIYFFSDFFLFYIIPSVPCVGKD
ncbi:MAG: hypothetical protein ACLSBD_08010 [Blautia massiliensis (ex Durand et al. 2017)]